MLTLALLVCISSAAAANTTQNKTIKDTSSYKAAGSTSTTTVTYSQLTKSANSVKKFVETNKRLPNYVTISNKQVTMPQYLNLISNGVVNLNSKKTTSITVKNTNNPTKPSQNFKTGTITKTEFVKVAGNLKTFINSNGRLPNYASTKLGTMRYESLIYAYSKIVVFYSTNKRLPNTVSVNPSSVKATATTTTTKAEGTTTTSNLAQYLKATDDAPSTSSTIKNLAASITKGKTTTLAKAQAIFNWVRDNLAYSFYYNTKKGALGALSSRSANCVDTSHLLVSLARASSIPARYRHGDCQFPDGKFGHVWTQLYVNGKWYNADAISNSNTFGTIKNWNLNTVKMKGTYASLKF